jgi:hypothetical protein
VVEPLGRAGMAEELGPLQRGIEPSPREGATHDRPDPLAIGAPADRSSHPEKDLSRRAQGTPGAEGGNSRGANLMRQREAIRAGALPPDVELSGVPIQILEGQGHHCAGPPTEPSSQEQHRLLASPVRCAPGAAL